MRYALIRYISPIGWRFALCRRGVPNCLVSATVGFFGTGVQTLTFLVTQAGSGETGLDPSGLDVFAAVNFAPGGIMQRDDKRSKDADS
jgi:hypothetical protein